MDGAVEKYKSSALVIKWKGIAYEEERYGTETRREEYVADESSEPGRDVRNECARIYGSLKQSVRFVLCELNVCYSPEQRSCEPHILSPQ